MTEKEMTTKAKAEIKKYARGGKIAYIESSIKYNLTSAIVVTFGIAWKYVVFFGDDSEIKDVWHRAMNEDTEHTYSIYQMKEI